MLTDFDSRNGHLRAHQETALTHGDYVIIGRKLLRVRGHLVRGHGPGS